MDERKLNLKAVIYFQLKKKRFSDENVRKIWKKNCLD